MIDHLKPYTLLADRYSIVEVLKIGKWGIVYLAKDIGLNNKFWVIKEMFALLTDGKSGHCYKDSQLFNLFTNEYERYDKEAIELFKTEAGILSGLEHPYLTRVFDWFYKNNRYYFVMDYVDGKTLFQIVKESKTFLNESDIVYWSLQICDVLSYIHNRNPPVIFRDLTPSNIMINKENDIKLIDFGLATLYNYFKVIGYNKTYSSGFCPPEQYGFGPTDVKSNIYSFGATLYYLITSTIPTDSIYIFNNSSELIPPMNINHAISKELQRIILKAMEVEQENRYKNVEEMRQELMSLKESPWMKNKVITCFSCSNKNSVEVDNCFNCNKIRYEEKNMFLNGSDWNTFHGVSIYGRVFFEKLSPCEKWSFTTGDKVISSPAISKKHVFIGSSDGNFYCLDKESGNKIWKFSTGGKILSSPNITDNYMFEDLSKSIEIIDFNIQGKKHQVQCSYEKVENYSRICRVYFGSFDGILYALEETKGERIWSFKSKGAIKSSPAIFRNMIYFGSLDHYLYCLDITTGTERWNFKSEDRITCSPLVSEDRAFVASSDQNLYCLQYDTGKLIWKINLGSDIFSLPSLFGNILFIGAGESLYALDSEEGGIIWKYETSDHITTSPAIGYGKVYIGSYDGNLYALDMDTGKCIWKFFTDEKIVSSPSIGPGTVYFGSCDCNIYAIDARTGVKKWSYHLGEEIYSSPAISGRILYVGCNNNKIYALEF